MSNIINDPEKLFLQEEIKLLKEQNKLLKRNQEIITGTIDTIPYEFNTPLKSYIKQGRVVQFNLYIDKGGTNFEPGRISLGTLEKILWPQDYMYRVIPAQTKINYEINSYTCLLIHPDGKMIIDNPNTVQRFFINVTYMTKE